MAKKISKRCATCRFYDGAEEETIGLCRRYAPEPHLLSSGANTMQWPQVSNKDWCGEYDRQKRRPSR